MVKKRKKLHHEQTLTKNCYEMKKSQTWNDLETDEFFSTLAKVNVYEKLRKYANPMEGQRLDE